MSKTNRKKVKGPFVVSYNEDEINSVVYDSLEAARDNATELLNEVRAGTGDDEDALYVSIYRLCEVEVAKSSTKVIFEPSKTS